MSEKGINQEQDNHDKIQAETARLLAETSKINSGNKYYLLIVGAFVTLTIMTVVKIFL